MDIDTDRATLMRVSRDWARAAAAGDLERILSFWSDDAVVMPPGQPALSGKTAIRAFLQEAAATPGFSITWEPERADVTIHGECGYMIERNRTTFADNTGTIQSRFGKAVTVWRKSAAGEWKCVIDIWNDNPTAHVL